MEENQQNQSNPQGGNVMDVQVPQQNAPVEAPAPQDGPVQAPPTPIPAPVNDAQKAGLSPELIAQAEAETKKPEATPGQQQPKAHGSRKRGPKLVIALAVVVFIALAGVAVYAYMQSQDKAVNHMDDTNHDHSHMEGMDNHAEPPSAQELDDAAKELDETINATNEADEIPGDGLNESSVGL